MESFNQSLPKISLELFICSGFIVFVQIFEKLNARVSIYSLADLNIGHCVELRAIILTFLKWHLKVKQTEF